MSQIITSPDFGIEADGTFHPPRAQGVLIGRTADTLGKIKAPGIAAAIWQRQLDASFSTWMSGFRLEDLPELRVTVPVGLAKTAVRTACDIAGIPDGPEARMLASDIDALAFLFGKIMNKRYVQIRLDVSDETMCPKFHLDNVPARLLCTYKGPGTEYVPDHHQSDPSHISTMNAGAVGLFRGATWDADEGTGLLHRSPAVPAEEGSRLLLVIDAGE